MNIKYFEKRYFQWNIFCKLICHSTDILEVSHPSLWACMVSKQAKEGERNDTKVGGKKLSQADQRLIWKRCFQYSKENQSNSAESDNEGKDLWAQN